MTAVGLHEVEVLVMRLCVAHGFSTTRFCDGVHCVGRTARRGQPPAIEKYLSIADTGLWSARVVSRELRELLD